MINKKLNIAVVGATGAVGETIISILEERNFPVDKLYPLASHRSVGKTVLFKGEEIPVQDLATFDFSKTPIAFFSAGGNVSAEYVPIATKQGAVVIDNTSQFRYDDDVPLVVPEVNPHEISRYTQRGIIANPNCSTIQMLVALKPIYDAVGISRINVATYQAVSGTGKSAIKELALQAAGLINGQPVGSIVYPHQIAFNILPHVDAFQENGYTREEMKMVWETQKIFNDAEIKVNPTAVRVPVFHGHSEAVNIETKQKITAEEVRKLLAKAPGIELADMPSDNLYPTAVTHAAGRDPVYVGRIREDISHPNGINLWVVADNIRKGAALNAVQVGEILLEQFLF